MGKKGAKLTSETEANAARLVETLAGLGEVTRKKMFGGVGIFESGTMFGIVDSSGRIFFRGGESNAELFREAGSEQHGRMPYHSVPDAILADAPRLLAWGESAVEASRQAKKS